MITNTQYIILIFIFMFFIIFVGIYKKIKYPEITLEMISKNKDLLAAYLSRYYITNMSFTILCVILYILGKVSIIVYLRVTSLSIINQTTILDKFPLEVESMTSSLNLEYLYQMFPILLKVILFVISLTLYYVLLDKLFFQEILKMHFFLEGKPFYHKISRIFRKDSFEFIGKLALFFHNIGNLRFESCDDDGHLNFIVYKDIYENKYILQLSKFCVYLAIKFNVMFYIFKMLQKCFLWLFMRIDLEYIIPKIPFLLYFFSIFYDIIHLKLYYTLYSLFVIYLIRLLIQVKIFIMSKNGIIDLTLYTYFYDDKNTYSMSLDVLYMDITIKYVLNKFQRIYDFDFDEENIILGKRIKKIYKRWAAICINFIFLSFFIFKYNIYVISIIKYNLEFSIAYILIIINIIIIIISCQIFYLKDNTISIDMYGEYEYKQKYNIIFWILIWISYLISISIIMKSTLQLSLDNVVWTLYNIEILRYYTLSEKMNFLYKYIKVLLRSIPMFEHDKDNIHFDTILLTLQEYLNSKKLNIDNLTLNDLKIIAFELISIYYNKKNKKFNDNNEIRKFMDGIRDAAIGYIVWSYAFTYSQALYVVLNFSESKVGRVFVQIMTVIFNKKR